MRMMIDKSMISVIIAVLLLGTACFASNSDVAFEILMKRLIDDGYSSFKVNSYFSDENVRFVNQLVPMNMLPKDNPDIYSGFLEETEIEDGLGFYLKWRSELLNMLDGTQIPPEYVIAILKVESNLGKNSGSHLVFTTLATISAMNNPLYWKHIADTSQTVTLTNLQRRAKSRSEWAYKELKALLELCYVQGWNPLEIRGSWAGAFGWAQFLPSSYIHYGRDGSGDDKLQPNNIYDAVASLSYYLKQARWGNSQESRRKAIHRYNPSNAYVDCIMNYAEKLKKVYQAEMHTYPGSP